MKDHPKKYSGILLAGGKSSRMGDDKAFMKYKDRFLYEYSFSILKSFSQDILISSSNTRFNNQDYRCVEDEMPDLGPISGIFSCLKRIKYPSAIVLPCDLPFISVKTVETLLNNSQGYDITVALNHQNFPEPLIGIYSSAIISRLEKMINSGNYKLQNLLKDSKTHFVKIPQISPETFLNINNPEDYNSLG